MGKGGNHKNHFTGLRWTELQRRIRYRLARRGPGETLTVIAQEMGTTLRYLTHLLDKPEFVEALNEENQEVMGQHQSTILNRMIAEAIAGDKDARRDFLKLRNLYPSEKIELSGIPKQETNVVVKIEGLYAKLTSEERAAVMRGARLLERAQARLPESLEAGNSPRTG